MRKGLKITLIVIGGIIVLAGVFAIVGTAGLAEALALEIQPADLGEIEDGIYTGSYENGRWSNDVEVTVMDHRITDIRCIGSGSPDGREELRQEVTDAVIAQQQMDVDTVSGATATTKSFLKAVEDALNKAKQE